LDLGDQAFAAERADLDPLDEVTRGVGGEAWEGHGATACAEGASSCAGAVPASRAASRSAPASARDSVTLRSPTWNPTGPCVTDRLTRSARATTWMEACSLRSRST